MCHQREGPSFVRSSSVVMTRRAAAPTAAASTFARPLAAAPERLPLPLPLPCEAARASLVEVVAGGILQVGAPTMIGSRVPSFRRAAGNFFSKPRQSPTDAFAFNRSAVVFRNDLRDLPTTVGFKPAAPRSKSHLRWPTIVRLRSNDATVWSPRACFTKLSIAARVFRRTARKEPTNLRLDRCPVSLLCL